LVVAKYPQGATEKKDARERRGFEACIKEGLWSITIGDFKNPWNLYEVFLQKDEAILEWWRDNGLLTTSFSCPKCDGVRVPIVRASCKRVGGPINALQRDDEYSINKHSFLDKGIFLGYKRNVVYVLLFCIYSHIEYQ
jgi:hypothetical protein